MDAATFTAIRLNEKRAADLDIELAHLAAHRDRRAALGDAAPVASRRRFWRRRTGRGAAPAATPEPTGRPAAAGRTAATPALGAAPVPARPPRSASTTACDPSGFALAGPTS